LPFLPIWISNKIEFGSLSKSQFIKEVSISYWFATKDAINSVHNSGKKVNVWTVDDSERIKQLIDIGVDGVITNQPNIKIDI
jgi:glycerophosphoryl diester phosphodiesterase